MSDKPILFSAPMVRALLAGTKTQTRRILTAWTDGEPPAYVAGLAIRALDENDAEYRWPRTHALGDRLWVKEAARISSWSEDGDVWMTYAADDAKSRRLEPDDENFLERLCARVERAGAQTNADGWYENIPPATLVRPSIHMPRWASRITLTVTDVRVQRLQDISDADAFAEGIPTDAPIAGDDIDIDGAWWDGAACRRYRKVWEAINGPGSWDANPWVAAYTFTVALGNIDHIARAA